MNKEYEKCTDYESLEYLNLSSEEIANAEKSLLLTRSVKSWNKEIERMGGVASFGEDLESVDVLFIRDCPKNYFKGYEDEPYSRFPELLNDIGIMNYAVSFAWPMYNPFMSKPELSMPLSCDEVFRLHRLLFHQIRLFNPRIVVYMDHSIKFYNAFVRQVDFDKVQTDWITNTLHVIDGRVSTFTYSPAMLAGGDAAPFVTSMEHIKDYISEVKGE